MALLFSSLIAGFLTVLAPCILPLLPVVLAGSLSTANRRGRLLMIILGLTLSVITFSLLLKATTSLLGVPQLAWQVISGSLLVGFGLVMLFPKLWERVATPLSARAGASLQAAQARPGSWGDFWLGAALGPVFNSCSPTYALIVATILPISFGRGLVYLSAYALGLAVALLLIALLGRTITSRLGFVANPQGWFHKLLGLVLILVGLGVGFGADKTFQTYALDQGWYAPIERLEQRLNWSN